MKAKGQTHIYADNVDTDVIIPARYLNTSDPKELASHCMCDIDADFVHRVKPGDIILFQNNNPQAAPAMVEIIEKLKSLGYRFETVSGLLGEHYTVNAQGIAIPAKPGENS